MSKKTLFSILFVLFHLALATAQVPQLINYQGMITDGDGNPVNGTLSIQFKIYENAVVTVGETPLWNETQSVTLTDGIYSVLLGSITPIPYSIFNGSIRYLGTTIGGDPEMTPRRALVSVGYAYRAQTVDNLDGIHTQNGNVGIGKTDPTEALDVEGNVHASGIIKSGNSIIINGTPTGGEGPDQITASSGSLAILGDPDSSDIKVGIGTTTPGATLEVINDFNSVAIKGISENVGVYGETKSASVAVFGIHNNNGNNNGNRGYLGGSDFAVLGRNVSGNNGYFGSDEFGAYGQNINGNEGYLGSDVFGAYGKHNNGNYGYLGSLFFGAYGVNSTNGNYGILGGGSGVVGYNSSGNTGYLGGSDYAVFGEAKSTNGYAGYFVGRGHFTGEMRASGIFSDGADIIAGNGGGLLISGGGKIDLMDKNGNGPIISLDPKGKTSGTITTPILAITGGGDLAEPFDIAGSETIKAGMVVAIDPENPGQLCIADKAYDRTVAGCVSGANGINPGLTMQQKGSVVDGSQLVALSGRVFCWADASYGAIQPGDLLTTSATPGHAMKVSDYKRAQGAILGKAMTLLEQDKGLVLLLVTLQ